MDALVLPFLLVLLLEVGGASSRLALALAHRFGPRPAVVLGIAAAALLCMAVAASGGHALAPELPPRVRGLLLGLSFLLAAAGRLFKASGKDASRDWHRLGAFGASLASTLVAVFGGEAMLVVAVLAAAGRSPWLAAPAGALGLTLAAALPLASGEAVVTGAAMRSLRIVLASGLALAGLILVLKALGRI